MDARERRLVLVPGAPGSGKTTLAVPLAAELGFALLVLDANFRPRSGYERDRIAALAARPVDQVRASLRAVV